MSNTLTDLAPILYSAAQEVSQEAVGVLDAINLNFDDKGAAVGDTIKLPLAPAASATDYTPAMTTAAGTDKIAQAIEVTINKSVQTSWHLTGEQIRSLENANSDKEWVRQLVAQGMRTLKNEAEEAAWKAVYKGASRAYGTLGTAPFGSDINDIAAVRKILRDNGAPMADLQLCINTEASYNLQKLAIYQQAQAAGSDAERRNGIFGKQFGFSIRESGQIGLHTAGTETSGPDCTAVEPIGETSIAYDGGTLGQTFLAGDIVQNTTKNSAGTDTNKYVVSTLTTTSATGTGILHLNRPGLKVATAIGDEWAVQGNYTPNVAFERSAVVGAMRIPLIPDAPHIKQIPISAGNGMTFLLVEIVGDGMITWRLHLCYGFKAVQPEYIAILAG
jgi:hypothetical protein